MPVQRALDGVAEQLEDAQAARRGDVREQRAAAASLWRPCCNGVVELAGILPGAGEPLPLTSGES